MPCSTWVNEYQSKACCEFSELQIEPCQSFTVPHGHIRLRPMASRISPCKTRIAGMIESHALVGMGAGWSASSFAAGAMSGFRDVDGVANHQQRAAVRRAYLALATETRLLVGADRACVAGVGIDHDAGRSVGQQLFGKGPDKRGAMAAPEHVGLADKLIETARPDRLRPEADIPCAQ